VYCRALWPISKAAGSSASGGVTISEDGYVNLASIAGMSTERDTSSCEFFLLPLLFSSISLLVSIANVKSAIL
jgi:hypothetical protein